MRIALGLTFFLGVSVALGGGQAAKNQPPFPETAFDFGSVPRGAQLLHRFAWTNHEKGRLEVTEARATCGCATVTPSPRVLEPGQTGTIDVHIDARRFVGDKTIHVHLLIGPERPQAVTLTLHAHSRPDIVYNPGEVDFGIVNEGAAPALPIEIEYAGSLDWRVEGVTNPSPSLTTTLEEMYRRPGQVGYRLKVGLRPEVPGGDFKHVFLLKTNDPANPTVPVLVQAVVRPAVSVAPNPLFFGSLRVGQTVTRRVTLRADRPFQIKGVSGDGGGLTAVSPPGPNTTHVLTLTLRAEEPGDLARQLIVHTDRPQNPDVKIIVQGQITP